LKDVESFTIIRCFYCLRVIQGFVDYLKPCVYSSTPQLFPESSAGGITFAADRLTFRNFGFSDSCSMFEYSKISFNCEKEIKKLRDSASADLKKSRKGERREQTLILTLFTKKVDKLFKEAAKEMANLAHLSSSRLIRFAHNGDEMDGDFSEEVECAVSEVRRLMAVQMAAVRKISNQASFT
jgi:hypothetical protein